MHIAGIGIVAANGRGINLYQQALENGWVAPAWEEAPDLSAKRLPIYRVEEESIIDKAVLKEMRRADRFSKMAVISAWDAIADSGISVDENGASLGIILATAFGPHVTTFRFLDDIIDYGDASVSPTAFSHSVHNAAASYISYALGIRGPALTMTLFSFPFHEALVLARAWINEGRCENVLVGGVDECGAVMTYICSQKLRIAGDGKIRPFLFSPTPEAIPGEGCVFFLLTNRDSAKKYGSICDIVLHGSGVVAAPDICLLDADGMAGDETYYKESADPEALVAAYTPVFGSMMIGSAFHCAAAALMLRNQVRYACPVQDNPYNVNLCEQTEQAKIKDILCIRYDCNHQRAVIRLK